MDWYYAVGAEQFGPFDQEAFERFVSQGRITGVTLVWHEELDDWIQYQLLSSPAPVDPSDIPPIPVLAQCSQCRRQATGDDMVQYRGHWVCAECKDTFYQRVREGGFSPQYAPETGRYRFAGFWIRVGAAMLDGLILFVVSMVLGFMVGITMISSAGNPEAIMGMQIFANIIQMIISVSYVTCFLGKYGATPGKMACGLKVIVSDGQRLSYWRAFGRHWAVVLSTMIPYISGAIAAVIILAITVAGSVGAKPDMLPAMLLAIGVGAIVALLMAFPFYMAGLTRENCALHDFICNTRVIRTR